MRLRGAAYQAVAPARARKQRRRTFGPWDGAGWRHALLWRAGPRIDEALGLSGADLDRRRGSVLVCRGKGGRRREVGMDEWACEQLRPWTAR